MQKIDRFYGCLLGLATGDAVGTTVEFKSRGSFQPIIDMTGGGPFNLNPGEWTDDTSMALCLATSLIERKRFDPIDQMDRYCKWMNEGYLSSNGKCFDIGTTVRGALQRYQDTGEPLSGSTDELSAGNGCLMRLAPVPMFYYLEHESALKYAAECSRTTHGAQECIDACILFADILFKLLSSINKDEALFTFDTNLIKSQSIKDIASGTYKDKKTDDIHGSGYVVQSLEAALWCFLTTDTFKDAILNATNLGDDADTTAAICGQVAGAYYGVNAIPNGWLNKLVMNKEISRIAKLLYESNT